MLPSCHVADGLHPARLLRTLRFENAHGPRVGFEFELEDGQVLLSSTSPSTSPRSRLVEILKGLLGRDPTIEDLTSDLDRLEDIPCKVLTKTEHNRSGKTYSKVAAVLR